MTEIRLTSPAFADRQPLPERYGHDHTNVSPPLRWTAVPDDAAELVLLCEDPGAGARGFVHWLVTGIDPHTGGVEEGQAPPGGRQWRNDFGERGWAGPQPPKGDPAHHYVFHLYALRSPIRLPERPSAAEVRRQVEPVTVAEGSLIGTYRR